MIGDRYYYHRLSEKNQYLYRLILKAATDYVTSVRAGVQWLYSQEDLTAINNAIVLDNPYLFYYSGYMNVSQTGHSEILIELLFDFDQGKYEELKKKLSNKTIAFLNTANMIGKTEEERVRAIHDLLTSKVVYDQGTIGAFASENSEEFKYAHSILGVMLNKKAVCEGIAKAFKYLLNAIDIGSIVIVGEAKPAFIMSESDIKHAWNIVKIEGDNYYVDITWDIAESNNDQVSYDYYNLTEQQIRKDHFGFKGFPICNSQKYNYFFMTNRIMYSEEMLLKYVEGNIRMNVKEIYVRLEFECNFMKVLERLQNYIQESMSLFNKIGIVHFYYREKQNIIRIFFD